MASLPRIDCRVCALPLVQVASREMVPDRQRRFHGFGVDTVQALMLAMMMVRVELLTSPVRDLH